jgi:hypothetical protein
MLAARLYGGNNWRQYTAETLPVLAHRFRSAIDRFLLGTGPSLYVGNPPKAAVDADGSD